MVYLCQAGYRPLTAYLEQSPPAEPTQPLFRSRLRKPMTVGGIQERVHKYAQESGVAVRELQKLNCPNVLGLDCQIQAFCPEIRRIWQYGESIMGQLFSGIA